MDPLEGNSDKITPKPSSFPMTLLALIIIGLQVLVGLVSYPFLPAMVPSHWNLAGQVDAYSPKLFSVIFGPTISLALYLLIRLLLAISPKLGRDNQASTLAFVNRVMVGVWLLFLVIQLTTIAIALGMPIDVSFVINLAISLLFLFMGNYMGKVRRNFWAGIRTPWTLASDVVWERTHRLGGWLFVATGIVGVVSSFFAPLRLWVVVGLLIIVVIITVVYSYLVYHKLEVSGKNPLSYPFNHED